MKVDPDVEEYRELRVGVDTRPFVPREEEPIVESECPVCHEPVKRANRLCARCRVAA